jgi:hypothetical protein
MRSFAPIPADPKPTEAELLEHWPKRNGYEGKNPAYYEMVLRHLAEMAWKQTKEQENPDAFLVSFIYGNEDAYYHYRKSAEYEHIRKAVMELHDNECACCDGSATQIHYRDYRPRVLRGEDLNALVPLCDACHKLIETHRKGTWEAGECALAAMVAQKIVG